MNQLSYPGPVTSKQWAHFAIDAVRIGVGGIEAVRVREVMPDGTVSSTTTGVTRTWVIQKIEAGFVFKTIFETYAGSGRWNIGAQVVIEVLHGVKYIKTVRDGTPRDNLGNLPRF